MFTKQEVFDKVVAGLRAQGYEQSLNVAGHCSFRGKNGTKCAVGHILPDDIADRMRVEYTNEFGQYLDQIPGFSEAKHYYLLDDLMGAHDNGHDPGAMMRNLREVAKNHNLDAGAIQCI